MTLQEKQILRDPKGDFHHDITLSIKTNLELWKVKIQFHLFAIHLLKKIDGKILSSSLHFADYALW